MFFPLILVKGRKGKDLLFGGSAEQIPPAGKKSGSNWLVKGIADKQIASPLKASVVSS